MTTNRTFTEQEIRDALQRVADRAETNEAWEMEFDGLSGADLCHATISSLRHELGLSL